MKKIQIESLIALSIFGSSLSGIAAQTYVDTLSPTTIGSSYDWSSPITSELPSISTGTNPQGWIPVSIVGLPDGSMIGIGTPRPDPIWVSSPDFNPGDISFSPVGDASDLLIDLPSEIGDWSPPVLPPIQPPVVMEPFDPLNPPSVEIGFATVPEPSSVMSLLSAASVLLLRRKKASLKPQTSLPNENHK